MIPEALRALLLLYLIAAFGLALSYLRRRRMTLRDYTLWGIFALILPVFGPFFVIAAQPGRVGRPVRRAGGMTPPVQPGKSASGAPHRRRR